MTKLKNGACAGSTVGFLLNSVASSEINWRIISQINRFVEIPTIIFQETKQLPFMKCRCPLMSYADAWSFQGVLVAVDWDVLTDLKAMLCPRKKIFYCVKPQLTCARKGNVLEWEDVEVWTRTAGYAGAIDCPSPAKIQYKFNLVELCQSAGII